MDSVTVNGKQVVGNTPVIVDTGTTLVVGHSDVVDAMYASIPGAKKNPAGHGMYTVPCDGIPDVSITFGGKAFTISSETFNIGPMPNSTSDCFGGIVGQDGQDFWVIGDVFLRNVYSTFDVGRSHVGFADLA